MKFLKTLIIAFIIINIFGCTEKTTYSGKIILQSDLSNIKVENKTELIKKLGLPSYIDILQNKYFYYTEKNKSKNFYINKKEYSFLFIFELDQNDNIIKTQSINLLDIQKTSFNKKRTPNNIIERGLIEKVFGGVGPNQLPDSF